MIFVAVLLCGVLTQEPYSAQATDPERLMRVSVYERLQFRNAEIPFQRQDPIFVPEDRVPSSTALTALASENAVIIEVCRPSQTGAAGQWVWPTGNVEQRKRLCMTYGSAIERQP